MIQMLIAIWSVSLFQFSVTIQDAESKAQEEKMEEVKLEKKKEKEKADEEPQVTFATAKRSNRVAPALYTHKLAQRKAIERQRERRDTMDLNSLRQEPTFDDERVAKPRRSAEARPKSRASQLFRKLAQFEEIVQRVIHAHIHLIQLLTPMLLQDGPFLIMRLFVVSNYDTSESNMFLFLIAKNALVVMLQVYRICVLYCRPVETEDSEESLFHEQEAVRLRNVQTAHASVSTATVTLRAVRKFKAKQKGERKRARTFSLTSLNLLSGLKRKRKESGSLHEESRDVDKDEAS